MKLLRLQWAWSAVLLPGFLANAGAEIGVKLTAVCENQIVQSWQTLPGSAHVEQARNTLPMAPARPSFRALLQRDTENTNRQKSPTGAMLRSIFFPGWGQFYNGQYLKALLVFGLEAGFIGAAIYYNQKAHDDQDSAANRAFYADQRNTNYWRTGVVILLSMLDAYVDAHLSDFDESTDLSLRAGPAVRPGSSSPIPEMHISLKLAF